MERTEKKQRLPGSYTIEAAFLMPMVLTVLAMVIGLGFQSAGNTADRIREIRTEWQTRDSERLPSAVRAGQAAVSWLEEEE